MSSTITRKHFLQLGFVGLVLAAGCGDDETGDGSTGSGPGSGGSGTGGEGSSSGGQGTGGHGTGATGTGGDGTGGLGTGGSAGPGPGSGGSGNAMCAAMIIAKISNNHGHSLAIPLADVMAGQPKTYSAQGNSAHCHEVSLDANDFQTLLAGGTVVKFSCNGGDHEYVLSCAENPPAPGNPACGPQDNDGACN